MYYIIYYICSYIILYIIPQKKLSQPVVFWVTEGESKQVPMLTLCSEMKYACLEELGAAMIELPCHKSRFVMQVVVPDDRMGVYELENGLVEIDIQDLFRRKHQQVMMDLALPKLNLTENLNLSDSLKKMGMADLFSADTSDLSGLTGSRFLSLTEVKQKVVLEVRECKTSGLAGFLVPILNDDQRTKIR